MTGNVFTTPLDWKPKKKQGQLTDDQIKQFFDKGWVLIPDLIEKETFEKLKKGIDTQINDLVDRLYDAGKIKNKHEDKGFFQRMIYIEKEFPGAGILLHTNGILPDGAKELWSHEKLLNITEQLIGPDIAGNPIWNVRVKLPDYEIGVVPWHQDNAYYASDASNNTLIVTAWIPLLDTTEINGGMQMLDGTHKSGSLAEHHCCAGGTWYVEIPSETIKSTFGCDVSEASICNVPLGSVLLFNNMIVHRSSNNRSDQIRWSMDLRWQNPNHPNGRNNPNEKMVIMRSKQTTEADEEGKKRNQQEIDWSPVINPRFADRHFLRMENKDTPIQDQFTTLVGGPWMRRWPIVHHNKNTEYELSKTSA